METLYILPGLSAIYRESTWTSQLRRGGVTQTLTVDGLLKEIQQVFSANHTRPLISLCEQQRWRLTAVCMVVGAQFHFHVFFLVISKFWLFCLKPFHLTIIAQPWLKSWAVIAEKLRQIKENTSHQREHAVPEKRTKRGDLLITFLLKLSRPAAPRHSDHITLWHHPFPFMSSCRLLLLQIYLLLLGVWSVINMLTSENIMAKHHSSAYNISQALLYSLLMHDM